MNRILLTMPSYGKETNAAGRAFWRATSSTNVVYQARSSSLLALNFNLLWCQLLNSLDTDRPFTHFAMLHDDCQPEDGWVDMLIRQMDHANLDVLGVLSPIKDNHGLTSTATDRDDGDTWRPHARITMHEAYLFPETFTSEDVGRPLLLNTGCWVAKVGDWCRKVHFTINDRIVQLPDGRYTAQVEPEDWFFSRLLNELGLKTGVTRRVRLTHRGETDYTNQHPWGDWQFDKHYAKEPLVDGREGFRFPGSVPGWLTYGEGVALYDLCRDKDVIEIGSYMGRSTCCIAQSANHVWSIDPHDGRGTPARRDTHKTLFDNLTGYAVSHKVMISKTTTEHAVPRPADIVFIDGAHDQLSVEQDIEFAEQCLGPDGLMIFHDYRLQHGECDDGWDPGVTAAVNGLLASGAELLSRHGTLAVVRPKQRELSYG